MSKRFCLVVLIAALPFFAFGQVTNVPLEATNVVAVVVSNATGGLQVVSNEGTNTLNIAELPPVVNQIIGMLGPKAQKIALQLAIWVGTLRLLVLPFGRRLDRWLRDKLNALAEASKLSDDVWLAKLFANPVYRFIGVLLDFASIHLPTTAELNRAIALQTKAAEAAVAAAPPPPPSL